MKNISTFTKCFPPKDGDRVFDLKDTGGCTFLLLAIRAFSRKAVSVGRGKARLIAAAPRSARGAFIIKASVGLTTAGVGLRVACCDSVMKRGPIFGFIAGDNAAAPEATRCG